VRQPRGESRGSAAGNARGAGARSSFGWQKSIGRIARLVRWEVARPRGDRRALAGRKLEAPPDAGHERRDGESVREGAFHGGQTPARLRPRGFGSRALDTNEGALGLPPVLPYRAWRRGVLRLASQPSVAPSARSASRAAHRTAQRPIRACLRATTGASEIGSGPVKAARGPRRSEGCPHPRR